MAESEALVRTPFDKIALRALSHIHVLRGTGASLHIAILHERSEPEGRGARMRRVIPRKNTSRYPYGPLY